MNKIFVSVFSFLCSITNLLLAQPTPETVNKAVYNRIEYFFNSRLSDSIYRMANDSYKKQVEADEAKQILEYFYRYGRITQVDLIHFDQNIADYELRIGEKNARLKLSVDSALRYSIFQISEIQKSNIQPTPVVSVVEKTAKIDPLDLYIDSIARIYIQQPHTRSLAIGVLHHNRTKTFFYGETAAGNATLPTEDSIYEIGSLTQTFTATLLAHLAGQGIVQPEDSIVKFLPDSLAHNPSLQGITFQSLANHTSGLPKLPSNLDKVSDFNPHAPYASYTRKDLFAFLKTFQADTAPGDRYEYSPLGYGLLGELISIISKKTYGELIKEVITTPLKMTNTTDKLNPKTQPLVKGYDAKGQETWPQHVQAMAGATILKSTVKDLLTYVKAQSDMPTTPLENAMALTRQFTYFLPPDTDIGLAWHMNMVADIISYSHTGSTEGSSSFIGLVPDKKSALVILTNTAVPIDEICTKMMERVIATE